MPRFKIDGTRPCCNIAYTFCQRMAKSKNRQKSSCHHLQHRRLARPPLSTSALPRFSSGSLISTSLAIVTPSLQTRGRPHFLPISTHFDFSPANKHRHRRVRRRHERSFPCFCSKKQLFRWHGDLPRLILFVLLHVADRLQFTVAYD